MDLQPHTQPESTLVSMTKQPLRVRPVRLSCRQCSGGFFPGAAGFTIDGGIFTSNITNNVYNPLLEEQPSAFRTILLGDIKLMKEIRLNDESGVVRHRSREASIRRMYSAKLVGGQTGPITVAMYQGGSAEEEWRQLVGKYEAIRHPNIMQLYGLVCTKRLRAMIFYDDLIPFRQFLNRFQNSPILTTYINGYCSSEWHVRAEITEGPLSIPNHPRLNICRRQCNTAAL
ncbi:hypothetical protein B0H14DRAFT_2872670 [Mycena olivaceomarginata]|nr:hypothetical protein B0H14DRAFT_2872670 [Mycena olivaceomarginata]